MDEKAAYWDRIIEFHQTTGKDRPSAEAGLSAIQTIRRVLGSRWQPAGSGTPFTWPQLLESRLSIIYEPNYKWLIHFAKKLETLERIPGHELVLDRFGIRDMYPTALMEMDFGLRLTLSGIGCSYELQRTLPTPDIVANIEGYAVDIEITSLNQPNQDLAGMQAMSSVTTIALRGKCAAGGIWARAPTPPELVKIEKKVQVAVEEAKTGGKLVEVSEPGILSCVVAPEDMASQVQSPWQLGSFVMRTPSPLAKKDRLARTIERKAKEQLLRGNPSVLVVYDRFTSAYEAREFLNEKELELTVGAFPALAGVILVCPFMITGLMIGQDPPFQPRKETKGARTQLEHTLPDNEAEISTIWRHPMRKHGPVIECVLHCLENFPGNLDLLYGEK